MMKIKNSIYSNDLSNEFKLIHVGDNVQITEIGSINTNEKGHLYWAKNIIFLENRTKGVVVCSKSDYDKINKNVNVTYLITEFSPKLLFSKILNRFIEPTELINDVVYHKSNAEISIGDNVFIAKNVSIGRGSVIHSNVTIYSDTIIGENCVIQANSSIGTEGLGLELDPKTDLYVKFPQLGGVVLEDFVEVGPNSTIRRGALNNTLVKRGTKIGALCNIGHNCVIGKNCILTCNIITSGSSKIGDYSFIGVGTIIKNGIDIGDNVTTGQGSNVVKNIPSGEVWVGNPAKKIK